MAELKLKGAAELHALLQQLPVQVETKILRSALVRGARVIADEAKLILDETTDGTGLTKRSVKVTRNTREGRIIAKVKLKGPHAHVGYWLEHGVSAHQITVRDGEGSLIVGGKFVGKFVDHPGFAPKPFFRPAFDRKVDSAVESIGQFLGSYLTFGAIQAPVIEPDEIEEDGQ